MSAISPTAPQRIGVSPRPRKVRPDEGKTDLQSVGVRFMTWTEETGGAFSPIEQPIPPRTLVAPVHKHSHEDEHSFVIEGRMGALLGEDTVHADVGDLVIKPRDQWHAFWNPGDQPCRILKVISPGGFEHFFDELAAKMASPHFDPSQLGELGGRYGLESDPESIARLCAEHGSRILPPGRLTITGVDTRVRINLQLADNRRTVEHGRSPTSRLLAG